MTKATKAEQPSSNNESILDKSNRAKFGFQTWENIGDHVIGTYVGKYVDVPQKYNPNNTERENYVLLKEPDNAVVVVSGRQPKSKTDPTKVFWDMAKIPLGARIAFIYEEDRENDTPNPTKIIVINYEGEVNKDKYLEFKDKYNLSEFAEDNADVDESVDEPEVVEEI